MKNFNFNILFLIITFLMSTSPSFARINGSDSSTFKNHGVGNPNLCRCNDIFIKDICKPICGYQRRTPIAKKKTKAKTKKVAFVSESVFSGSVFSESISANIFRSNGVDNHLDCRNYPPRSSERQTCLDLTRGFLIKNETTPSFFLISCADSNPRNSSQIVNISNIKTFADNQSPGIIKLRNSSVRKNHFSASGRFDSIYCPAISSACSKAECKGLPYGGEIQISMNQNLIQQTSHRSSFVDGTFPASFKVIIEGTELTETTDCYSHSLGSKTAVGCKLPVASGGALRVDAIY